MKTKILTLTITLLIISFLGLWKYSQHVKPDIYMETSTYNLETLSKVAIIPDYKVIYSFPLKHTDGATTTLNLIKFATTSSIRGFVTVSGVYLRLDNYEKFKNKKLPEVRISVLIHELAHLTTHHNWKNVKDITTPDMQELEAYDIQDMYLQVRSLEEDNKITISKD